MSTTEHLNTLRELHAEFARHTGTAEDARRTLAVAWAIKRLEPAPAEGFSDTDQPTPGDFTFADYGSDRR